MDVAVNWGSTQYTAFCLGILGSELSGNKELREWPPMVLLSIRCSGFGFWLSCLWAVELWASCLTSLSQFPCRRVEVKTVQVLARIKRQLAKVLTSTMCLAHSKHLEIVSSCCHLSWVKSFLPKKRRSSCWAHIVNFHLQDSWFWLSHTFLLPPAQTLGNPNYPPLTSFCLSSVY